MKQRYKLFGLTLVASLLLGMASGIFAGSGGHFFLYVLGGALLPVVCLGCRPVRLDFRTARSETRKRMEENTINNTT